MNHKKTAPIAMESRPVITSEDVAKERGRLESEAVSMKPSSANQSKVTHDDGDRKVEHDSKAAPENKIEVE